MYKFNKLKFIGLLLCISIFLALTGCSSENKMKTEEEFINSFYQDEVLFNEAVDKIKATEWYDDQMKDKGAETYYKSSIGYSKKLHDFELPEVFIDRYIINSIHLQLDDKLNTDTLYVAFESNNKIEDFQYIEIYYSSTGEPIKLHLGEYNEDIGMYYFYDEVTNMFEKYTQRLNDHWFFEKSHYFRY